VGAAAVTAIHGVVGFALLFALFVILPGRLRR